MQTQLIYTAFISNSEMFGGYFVQASLVSFYFLQYSAQYYHLDLPPYSALVCQVNTKLDEVAWG